MPAWPGRSKLPGVPIRERLCVTPELKGGRNSHMATARNKAAGENVLRSGGILQTVCV